MGFQNFDSPYDWSRVARFRHIAQSYDGGCIDLSVGSPVDPVPQSVRAALSQASDEADARGYPQTIGSGELRNAIHDWFLRQRGVDLTMLHASVVPSVGSKEAVALMVSLLHLNAGDVVVQPKISYPTYEIGTQIAGATVVKVDDVTDVASWKNIDNVKAIWVNSPCNPTGEIIDSQQLATIVAAARAIGAVVLSDECYAFLDWREANDYSLSEHRTNIGERPYSDVPEAIDMTSVFNSAPCVLNPQVCAGSARGILSLYSLSKQSNMAGYRTAFIAGDDSLIEDMIRYRRQIGLIIPGPVQHAMSAALRDIEAVQEQKARYHTRLTMLVNALGEYGYDAHMPQGALYVWVHTLGQNCWEDMGQLAKLGIVPSPGEFYGAPEYLRFSITASDEAIRAAAARLIESSIR
ncbi:succinyldiaminopimelate transaminase [Bifidobacterium aquikefiri]|uniref:succinyldiaminopimelate transaminase n=1 Tax=Bifidobacterium aquikefiri TaxID=1653207 RepID=UPI0023F1A1F7|nr:succinyldiaminopimelate transaminase [Bifidobacterium aquikefiri]